MSKERDQVDPSSEVSKLLSGQLLLKLSSNEFESAALDNLPNKVKRIAMKKRLKHEQALLSIFCRSLKNEASQQDLEKIMNNK